MKQLIILITLFSINSNASTCYLIEKSGKKRVDCVSGFIPENFLSVSPTDPDTGKPAMSPEFIKLENGNYIFNRAGKDAWLARKVIDETAIKQDETDRASNKSELITACSGQGQGIIKLLCQEVLNN